MSCPNFPEDKFQKDDYWIDGRGRESLRWDCVVCVEIWALGIGQSLRRGSRPAFWSQCSGVCAYGGVKSQG